MLGRAGPILARLPGYLPTVFIEVGVNRGQLGEHLLRERPLLEWHGIDPWWHAPDHATEAYVRTFDGHAFQTAEISQRCYRETQARMVPFWARATIHRAASPGAAAAFATESATMAFIDAAHDEESVIADIEAWWPVVARGAWLAGHDYDNHDPRFRFGVKPAVDAWVARIGLPLEVDASATWFVKKP